MEKLHNLRRFRKAKGLTQKQLAEYADVSESSISQYESGKKIPSFETALKIAEALDCETADLVTTRTGIYDVLSNDDKKIPATESDGLPKMDITDELNVSDDQKELIHEILQMPPDKVSAFLAFAKSL